MSWRDGVDFRELIQRFDAGDRSLDLIALLNRAAFDCFHAPWETLPHPKPRESCPEFSGAELEETLHSQDDLDDEPLKIQLPKGNTPREDSDGLNEDPEMGTRQKSDKKATGLQHTLSPHTINPYGPAEEAENLLCRLDMVLEVMGYRAHISKGSSLIMELPYDPGADSQSLMTFQIDGEHRQVQVNCQSDIVISHVSKKDLERMCSRYNRRSTDTEARLLRIAERGRLRLRLAASLSFESMGSPASMAKCVCLLLQKNRLFWRQIRRNLPTG